MKYTIRVKSEVRTDKKDKHGEWIYKSISEYHKGFFSLLDGFDVAVGTNDIEDALIFNRKSEAETYIRNYKKRGAWRYAEDVIVEKV